jgi:ABC-type multidrug transport system fused ATPase/permease subunit
MVASTTASVAIAIACLGVVLALTVPACHSLLSRLRHRKDQYRELDGLYHDVDGSATRDSQAAYSDIVPRLILLLVSMVATLDALAFAILVTNSIHLSLTVEQWLQFLTWLALLIQSITIFITPSSVERYRLGVYSSICALVLIAAVIVENLSLWQKQALHMPRNIHLTLSLLQLSCASISMITSLLIPRRPDVYRNEKVVDRQHTTSVLGKLSFSWPTEVLAYAIRNRGLDHEDLPELSYENRAQSLQQRFESVGKKDQLWKAIFWAHKWSFIQQWVLQAICSVTNFLPQIALYFILKVLERRDEGINVGFQAWLLVLGLTLADVFSLWVESYMFFVAFMRVGVPIYEQLSAVVFGKAIRRKDVKGVSKTSEIEQKLANGDIQVNQAAGPTKGEDSVPEDDDEEDTAKTRQSTINLVGVDSKRISDFAMFNYIFLGSTIKMIFAIGFLVKLIGWIPMLAGFVAPALITPLNIWVSKKYAAEQDVLMKYRDQKMAVVTEALQGIRQIKFSALEKEWYEKILQTRRKELGSQWRVFVYDASLISIWIFGPVMLSAISLTVYAIIHKELSASVAFTTISVFEAIEMTLAIIPEMVTDLLDCLVSAKRIQEYLDSPDRQDRVVEGPQVKFNATTVSWPSDNPEDDEDLFKLRDLNLDFPQGELSVVSGRTGSGKSLLLSAIIGEAEIMNGTLAVPNPPKATERFDSKATKQSWIIPSSIAYVAQIPWIENATIRDNILFGLPLDDERYKKVLSFCALEKDLEMLEDGEMTDIGANGINLSGGQKWRVSFARALYSRAGILVMDDIFSAVDANVGRHLYEKALTGELGKGRTRILVTHHVALCLPRTKYSVLLADGTVDTAGLTEELRKSGQLKNILAQDVEEMRKEEEELIKQEAAVDDGGGLQKMLTNQSRRSRRESTLSSKSPDLQRRKSHATLENGHAEPGKRDPPKKFTEDEHRETGTVKWDIYAKYIRASGGWSYWALILLAFGVWILVYLARSYWISVWTRSYHTEDAEHVFGVRLTQQTGHYVHHFQKKLSATKLDSELAYYLGVYLGISLLAWVIGTLRYFSVMVASIRASKVMFENLTFAVLRAPLRWLDTIPLGRILNRFTSDFNMLDSRIAYDISFFAHNLFQVVAVLIAGIFVTPILIVFALALLAACLFYALRYLAGAREVKRLESNAKSPVFEQFSSVLTGIATIRAFDKTDAYIERMYKRIDTHCRAYWHLWLFNRWMGFRLNMVGAIFAGVVAALIVSIRNIDAPLAGFALSFALNLSEAVIWMLRQYSNVELDSNATERIVEYSQITLEKQGGDEPPAAWPTKGELEVNELVVAYAPDLPPVLKGLTFSVSQNQRIGVVGRTGAGKSSLTLALFRFLEARSGSVHIDGIDISKISLHHLRSRLAIIPQDPVLFSGTVRSNLDPFEQHGDAELRDALARVHLIPSASVAPSGAQTPVTPGQATPASDDPNTNKNIFRSLSSKISEGGLNLSQGQRQLLCLARAIVSRPKIMVLDEATSAVDMETDALIQRSIREEFGDATLIVIAHRLSTIADFDKILVMGEGRVVEFDEPSALMKDEQGVFKGLVEESGERKELEGVIARGGRAADSS